MIGTADWHWLRKFSLTSSQAHGAFVKGIQRFKDDPAWMHVARYLYGDDWQTELGITVAVDAAGADAVSDEDSDSDSDDEEDRSDPLAPMPIEDYLRAYPIPQDGDVCKIDAVCVLKRHAGVFEGLPPPPDIEYPFGECPSGEDEGRGVGANDDEDDSIEGPIVCPNEDAAKEAMPTNSHVIREMLKILGDHVHETYRKKGSRKDLVEWFMRTNSARTYQFFSSKGLSEIMNARQMKFASGRRTVAKMINALSGEQEGVIHGANQEQDQQQNDGLSPEDAIIQAVLTKSFLPHQKGVKREYCSLGHRLEIPVVKNWVQVARDMQPSVVVRGVYSTGLAAKREKEHAKDSIDFIMTVEDPKEGGILKAWGFEAKGRVTVVTASDEEHHVQHLHEHVRIPDERVYNYVRSTAERFQVLQHSYVYDLDTVVLGISDRQSELIQSAIIDFSEELRDDFGKVLEDIKDISLSWAYPSADDAALRENEVIEIPEDIFRIAATIPTINGDETLQGTLNLWYVMSLLPKPFPSFKRLIPAIYAFWNAVKGGSDTSTKLMDDCIIRVPKVHLNTETAAISRLLALLFVLIHRLMQVLTSKELLDYPSLQHYRHAASHRQTYHLTLLKCSRYFNQALSKLEDEMSDGGIAHAFTAVTPLQIRRGPARRRVGGTVPSALTFGATLSTVDQTPRKIAAEIRRGTANEEIQSMVDVCPGIMMQYYDEKKKGPVTRKCDICESKTSWYCVRCKRWMCVSQTSKSKKSLNLYSHTVKGKKLHFIKSCYHQTHQDAWEKNFCFDCNES